MVYGCLADKYMYMTIGHCHCELDTYMPPSKYILIQLKHKVA